MKRQAWLWCSLIVLGVASSSHAAPPWTGLLDPSRAVDWTTTKPGVVGGIPNRTTVCATINAYSGTAAAINNAIAACPSGQVVQLGAGTFTLTSGIDFSGVSNVTLRGAGPRQTIIFPRTGFGAHDCGSTFPGICVSDTSHRVTNSYDGLGVNWVASYAKGATVITLAAITTSQGTLSVGKRIVLDQNDDSGVDNGGILVTAAGPAAGYQQGPVGRTGAGYPTGYGRSQRQHVTVTSISNNGNGTYNVGISPGLYMSNWRASQNPQAFWAASTTEGIGIENLTLDWANAANTAGIAFVNSWNNWVKNVRSLHGARNHIWIYFNSAHNTIRDSYFFQVKSGGGSQSYGVESYSASDNLIENNIFDRISSGVMTGPHTGDVVGYNYNFNVLYGLNWQQGTLMGHDAGGSFNLYEGNDDVMFIADLIHGSNHLNTAFRNRLNGKDPNFTANTNAVYIEGFDRGYNFIGNVLGTAGYHTVYESYPGGPTNGSGAIYILGFSAGPSASGTDGLVRRSLMRWGNYDTVNGAVRWDTTEAQPPAITYVNANTLANPADRTLPASLYYTARPAWWGTPWGTPPWPAVGPEVSGGNVAGTAGHAWKIPARLCLENTSRDSGGALLFDSSACYTAAPGSRPSPPQDLTVR